jgi:hypothetical protein
MNKQRAGLLFAGVCIVLAILLLAQWITPLVSGVLFALALVFLGLSSKGFKKE